MISLDIKTRLSLKKKVDPTTGCWLWKGEKNREGYGKITFMGKKRLVHRVSAMLYNGYDLNSYDTSRLQINHTCKNRNCFRPEHLYIGTHTQNMQDVKNTPKTAKVRFPARPKRNKRAT